MNHRPEPALLALEHLVNRAVLLEENLRAQADELRQIKNRLADIAIYKSDGKTGRLSTIHYVVKVHRRDNVIWRQEQLRQVVRPALGEQKFFELFECEFKARARQVEGYLTHGPAGHYGLLIDAREVTPGNPQVRFEKVERC